MITIIVIKITIVIFNRGKSRLWCSKWRLLFIGLIVRLAIVGKTEIIIGAKIKQES